MEKFKLYLISHTHWDREWYQTFQNYRYRLVRMMDDLINGLEKDDEYKLFHLDGQTILLEDYLQVRPESANRLKKLIQDGRILIGPWFVMPDEYLVSGEALVKNLQMGHEICKQYGVEPMKNGYVTDIFGHNSQFPQILNGFDIHSATLYRGIGDYEKDAFRWRSPDGSEVLTAKLEAERSYSNFYFAVRWPYEESGFDEADAILRMKRLVENAKTMAASGAALMMDGVDHCGMEPDIPKMIRFFEQNIPDIEILHVGIEEYFKQLDSAALEVIEGPLYHTARMGLNNQLLKNVLSSMVHIKQANDSCETLLTAVSEPLNAFCEMLDDRLCSYKADDYSLAPRRVYIDHAWKYLLTNQPHDSICGCSLTDVHRDNEYRFRQAEQMAEISASDCVNVITRNIRCTGGHQEAVLLYNPSQQAVKGVERFTLPVLYHENANRRFYDSENRPLEVQVLSECCETAVNTRLRQLVRFDRIAKLTVATEVEIPAFGYTVIYCDNLENIFRPENKAYGHDCYHPPLRLNGSQMTAHNRIDNGALTVELNAVGLLDVTVKRSGKSYRNLHLLENRSDVGDGWNWRPAVYDGIIFGKNSLEQFSVLSDGPNCTVWKLTYALRLPVSASTDYKTRSEQEQLQRVTTLVTVLKNSEQLRFETSIDNHTENNRMRVIFPTFAKADSFFTKTPFDLTEWLVKAADTSGFAELDTLVHPSQGISCIFDGKAPIALYASGLYEVEVTDNHEKALVLTLFRAAEHESGTSQPEDIKMQRKLSFRYALSFAPNDKTGVMLEGEQYRTGIQAQRFEQNPKADVLNGKAGFLELSDNKKLISLISEQVGGMLIRLYDISGIAEDVTLRFPRAVAGAEYLNLNGKQAGYAEFDNQTVTVHCPAHKIITVSVSFGD